MPADENFPKPRWGYRWTETEQQQLTSLAETYTVAVIAQRLGRSFKAIEHKLVQLNIHARINRWENRNSWSNHRTAKSKQERVEDARQRMANLRARRRQEHESGRT